MDILEKLNEFVRANGNEQDIMLAKEKDRLTNELFSLLLKAERKGFAEAAKITIDSFKKQ
jgi:hypothetical protein